jgi:hypothetical protein
MRKRIYVILLVGLPIQTNRHANACSECDPRPAHGDGNSSDRHAAAHCYHRTDGYACPDPCAGDHWAGWNRQFFYAG